MVVNDHPPLAIAPQKTAAPRTQQGERGARNGRLKVMKGAIDSSTLKPNWSRALYKIFKVKGTEGSKAPSFRVRDDDVDLLKHTYTATDLQKKEQPRLMKSPIKVQKKHTVRQPRTRQAAQARLAQPRRSARLASHA